MAQKTTGGTASAATNPAAATPTPTNAVNAQPTAAPNITDYVRGLAAPSGLSAEGTAYFDRITKYFNDNHVNFTPIQLITTRAEGRAYIDETSKYAIQLIADESCNDVDNTCIADQAPEFASALKSRRADAQLIQTIIVTKNDYPKAEIMAAFILNAIKALTSTNQLNLSSFTGVRFSVITRKEAVNDFIAKNSPHGIPARNDNGVLICVDTPTGQKDAQQRDEYVPQPILAISGYTRFLCPEDTGTQKYIPVAIITDIVSKIPNTAILPLSLAIAADAFIARSLWVRPYSSFAQKGAPNLGALFTDPKSGQPYKISNVDEFHRFCNDSLERPFLGIDITEGRARLANIEQLLTDKGRIDFINYMQIFGGQAWTNAIATDEFMKSSPDFNLWWVQNCTGVYSENGILKDTRCADYLSMINLLNDVAKAKPFLYQNPNASNHISMVRGFFADGVRNLYRTNTIVINAAFPNALIRMINNGAIKLNYDVVDNANFSISPLAGAAQANIYGTTLNSAFGGQGNQWLNNTGIYRF